MELELLLILCWTGICGLRIIEPLITRAAVAAAAGWEQVGYYRTRDPERLSRSELRLLPWLTGVPNEVPLYRFTAAPTIEGEEWGYRINDSAPWITPTSADIENHARLFRDE